MGTADDTSAIASSPLYRAMIEGGVDFRPWAGQGLGDNDCFLCSMPLADDDRTVEDVIPRWMQRDLRVADSRHPTIELPNLTTLTLDRVRVPACRKCNGGHLSRFEKIVAAALRTGPELVRALPERTMRIWFAKLAYGLRRNDMRLRDDIRVPSSGNIATAGDLEGLGLLHLLLQEARDVVHVPDGHSTFFVFTSQTVDCKICDFDLAVPVGWPHPVMMRFDNVTVMGAVDDRGALQSLRCHPAFLAAQNLNLHPIQVRALWALLVHQCTLLHEDRLPLRFGVSEGRLWVDRVPASEPTADPMLGRVTADRILGSLLNHSDDVIAAHGGAAGLLVNPGGVPRQIALEHGDLQLGTKAAP